MEIGLVITSATTAIFVKLNFTTPFRIQQSLKSIIEQIVSAQKDQRGLIHAQTLPVLRLQSPIEKYSKLKKIFGNRFTTIRFISPFSESKDEQIIPIFETSVHFQGYFAQTPSIAPRL